MSFAAVVSRARSEGRALLTEVEAKSVLAEWGIPVVETRLARSRNEAREIADELGYPVVVKVVSPDIAHKSDVGGVKLKLSDAEAVGQAWDEIMASVRAAEPNARIEGVSVQRMAEPGIEVIVGMTTDPQFGPVMMFGLGGIMVEVLKDVAFRLVPLEEKDAAEMIDEIRARPILDGIRGQPGGDIGALRKLLLDVSRFVEAHPEVRELDLNPVFVYPNGLVAVDARMVVGE